MQSQIAVNTFIENMATLAIERWLLHDLSALMPSEKVLIMTDYEIAAVAAEPEESQSQRKRLVSQIAVLEKAVRICRRHARQSGLNGECGTSLGSRQSERLTQTRFIINRAAAELSGWPLAAARTG